MASRHLRRGRRNILERNEVVRALNPFFDDFIVALNTGMANFAKVPAEQLADYRKRTKANMLNDHIVRAAKIALDGSQDVRVDEDCESCLFVFQGRVGLRIKKVDSVDRTKNIRTERQLLVDNQQLILPGIESLTFVTLGYKLDKTWTQITSAKIVCWRGRAKLWTIAVIEGVQANQGPLLQVTDEQFEKQSIVRSKKKKKGEA